MDYVEEKWENERFYRNWKKPGLKERPHWSNESGTEKRKRVTPKQDYHWIPPWSAVISKDTDPHGWQYAFSFSSKFKSKNKTTKFVRRRKWIRTASKTPLPKKHVDARNKELFGYVREMVTHPTNQLKISNRWHHVTEYKKCFVGSKFVNWLVKNHNMTREGALSLGYEMMEADLVRHVTNSQLFRDGQFFYRFTDVCEINTPGLAAHARSRTEIHYSVKLGLSVGDIVYTTGLDNVHFQYNNKVGKIVDLGPKRTPGHFPVKFRDSIIPPKSISGRNLRQLPSVDDILVDAFLEINIDLANLDSFAQSDINFDEIDDISDELWTQLIPIAGQRSRFKQWYKKYKTKTTKTNLVDKLEELSKMPRPRGSREVPIISYQDLKDVTPVSRGGHYGILFLAKYGTSNSPVLLKIAQERHKTSNWDEYQILKSLPLHPNITTQLALLLNFPHNSKLNPAVLYPINNHLSVFQAVQVYREDMYRLDKSLVVRLSMDIAEALRIFHSQNIIHRDIGLRNCMLAQKQIDHDEQRAILAEFGLCRQLEKGKYYTRRGEVLPWRWIAPETISNGECSKPSDVFMFGVALWEFLGVTPPFGDCTSQADKLALLNESNLSRANIPIAHSKWFPKPFWDLIQQCCHYDPAKRPPIESVIETLKNFPQSADYEFQTNETEENPLRAYDIQFAAQSAESKQDPDHSDDEDAETAFYDRLEIELEYEAPLHVEEFEESKENDDEISYQSSISDGGSSKSTSKSIS